MTVNSGECTPVKVLGTRFLPVNAGPDENRLGILDIHRFNRTGGCKSLKLLQHGLRSGEINIYIDTNLPKDIVTL